MGVLYKGPESAPEVAMLAALDEINTDGDDILIAVGGVTVATLLALDIVPDIGFIDGQTKREALGGGAIGDAARSLTACWAVNPPGLLTPELRTAIEQASALEEPVVVVVDGGEDLAPLFVHLPSLSMPWCSTVSPVKASWRSSAVSPPRNGVGACWSCSRWCDCRNPRSPSPCAFETGALDRTMHATLLNQTYPKRGDSRRERRLNPMAQRAFLTRSTTQTESEVCPCACIISRSSDCPPDVNGRLNTPREIGWPSRTSMSA